MPKVLQTKSHLNRNTSAQTNAPASAPFAHKVMQCKAVNDPHFQLRTAQPSPNPVKFVPARAKSSTIQRSEGSGASNWVQKDLATRYEHYILPLENLARKLLERKLIHVEEGRSTQENLRDLMGLFKLVHAERSQRQDDVRARLSPEGLAASQSLREGHKSDWVILVEAIIKNFAEKGVLKRELTDDDRIFLLQYMTMGATRTRPELRQVAEQAYNNQQGKTMSKL